MDFRDDGLNPALGITYTKADSVKELLFLFVIDDKTHFAWHGSDRHGYATFGRIGCQMGAKF